MTELTFANAELVGIGILVAAGVDPDIVVQSSAKDLDPPLVRVRRVPGEPRRMFDDLAHIEVLTFGSTYTEAQDLAEVCANAIRWAHTKATPLPGGLWISVDHTEALLPPVMLPWPNSEVRVFQATYLVVTRAQLA